MVPSILLTLPSMKVAFCSVALPLRSASFSKARPARLAHQTSRYFPHFANFGGFQPRRPLLTSWTSPYSARSYLKLNDNQIASDSTRRSIISSSATPPDVSEPIVIETTQQNNRIRNLREHYDKLRGVTDNAQVIELIKQQFPFKLDHFQQDALSALCSNSSVVLSAPTGAGKTVIGEMAVYLALCRQLRVFYTTPLKALSNQKFYDFKRLFGPSRVGLLTGDLTVNREADIIVMTTEIYRNMLYAEATEQTDGPQPTDGLFAVVFDEFHYLNDQDRGTVWEESVINSPPHILLVALSATMSNATDVRDWFFDVQGPTSLVQSTTRPVPLKFGYCDQEGLTPLFAEVEKDDDRQKQKGFSRRGKKVDDKKPEPKMHPKLLRKLKASRDSERNSRSSGRYDSERDEKEITRDRFRRITNRNARREAMIGIPSYAFVVRTLRKRDMLPCIIFIFSRAGCDRAAMAAAQEREDLVTRAETAEIQRRLDAFVSENPDMVQHDRLQLALKGIASHHAGLLPLWKLCVEELFQDGLIKVVFATETLAAGINMPARTTVISSLSKRAGEEGVRNLTTSEVLQMAGRAGRRGKDVVGHSLVLRSRNEGALEAFKVLTRKVDALESKFTPKYGMVLNLLLTRPLGEAKRLVDRSFGNFLRQKQISRDDAKTQKDDGFPNVNIETLRREKTALLDVLDEARRTLNTVDHAELRTFIKSLERVKAEKRALTYLIQQSAEMDGDVVLDTLTFAPAGTRLLLREKLKPSAGAERRQKRRGYVAAITAAGEGDLGEELRSFYLSGNEDELDDMEEDDSATSVIEAVLLDLHEDAPGLQSVFAAVDAHGQLRLFHYTAVSRILYDEEALDLDTIAPGWAEVNLPLRSAWRSISHDQYVASLPKSLNTLVTAVQDWRTERASARDSTKDSDESLTPRSPPEVRAQRNRVEDAKRAVREGSLYSREDKCALLAAKSAVSKIEATLDGSADPFGTKRRRRRTRNTAGRYAQLKEMGEENDVAVVESTVEDADGNSSWEEFMSLVGVLQHYGFVDDNYAVTRLGEIGAKVRSDNELWTSIVLLEPELATVSPVHLGAVLGATQMEGGRGDVFVEREVSDEVLEHIGQLNIMRMRLLAVQNELGAEVAVCLDAELMGLVEMWASGVTWVELLRSTSVQEGDVCRIMRRTLDVLRQIQHLPVVSPDLKRNARRAIALLDRFPITDDRTYWISSDEQPLDEDFDVSDD